MFRKKSWGQYLISLSNRTFSVFLQDKKKALKRFLKAENRKNKKKEVKKNWEKVNGAWRAFETSCDGVMKVCESGENAEVLAFFPRQIRTTF